MPADPKAAEDQGVGFRAPKAQNPRGPRTHRAPKPEALNPKP